MAKLSSHVAIAAWACFFVTANPCRTARAAGGSAPPSQPVANVEKREASAPAFSRDASRVVFVDEITTGQAPRRKEVWIVNVDGTDLRRLTEGPLDENPRFAPDGTSIVFQREHDVWTIGTDGQQLRNATNTPNAVESLPEFTNDGKHLVFLRQAAVNKGETASGVVLLNLETGAERVLLGNGYRVGRVVPDYRDGNWFYVLCNRLDSGQETNEGAATYRAIARLHIDGSPPTPVVSLKAGSRFRIRRLFQAGERIFVEVDEPDNFMPGIGVVENSEVRVLPDTPLSGDVAFDGRSIVGIDVIDNQMNLGLVLYDMGTGRHRPLREPHKIPFLAQGHYDAAVNFVHEGQYAKAIVEFTRAIEFYPEYSAAYQQRGWMKSLLNDEKAALADLAEAIRLDPGLAAAYETRGDLHEAAERYAEAIDDYSAAIALDPDNDTYYEKRATLYNLQGEVELALADFSAALKVRPTSLTALMGRAWLRAKRGDRAGALQDYSMVIRHYPREVLAYTRRAVLYRAMGKPALAKADEDKVRSLEASRKVNTPKNKGKTK